MIDPHGRRQASIARRMLQLLPLSRLSAPVLIAIVLLLAVVARPAIVAEAQSGVLDRIAWQDLPADGALGGHGAVIDGRSMTLIGGEQGDFQAPESLRSLFLGPAPAWTTRPESGDRPLSALVGRGLVGARAARISVDGAAETSLVMVCHCVGATTYHATWPASGGTAVWRAIAGAQALPYANGIAVLDAPRNRVIAFGGEFSGSGEIVTATWALDVTDLNTAQWQPLPPMSHQLIFQASDLDPRSGHVVAFGGQGADASPTAQLWRADLAAIGAPGAWTDVAAQAGAGPVARSGGTLTFAGASGWAVLYGGYSSERGELSDVWALDYRDPSAPRWRAITPDGTTPSARSGHSAVWDEAGDRIVVYGGLRLQGNGVLYLSDALALDLSPEVGPTATTPAPTATTATPTRATPATTVPSPTTPTNAGGRVFLPLSLRGADVRAGP